MVYQYSFETGGFYLEEVHGKAGMPKDVVILSAGEYSSLLNGLAAGKRIVRNAQGRPALAEQPEPSLEEARAKKLEEISVKFSAAERNGRLASSLGFEINADEIANRNTEGLITRMEHTGAGATLFCDYNNQMRDVTLAQIKTMRQEIIAYGQALYARKWQLRAQADAAESVADIQKIIVNYNV